jgi:hypothetical protein
LECGMEVIRWLGREPREHLRGTRFLVHTHNFAAGLLMVLQMRDLGYSAEFRPFGFGLEHFCPDESIDSALPQEPAAEVAAAPGNAGRRWLAWVRAFWPLGRKRKSETREDAK